MKTIAIIFFAATIFVCGMMIQGARTDIKARAQIATSTLRCTEDMDDQYNAENQADAVENQE
jgi:hypothetical protein